jgi:hypothetical protein
LLIDVRIGVTDGRVPGPSWVRALPHHVVDQQRVYLKSREGGQ